MRGRLVGAAMAAVLLLPVPVSAHAFGQRYDLPIPLRFFVVGAVVVLLYTFFTLGIFNPRAPRPSRGRRGVMVPRWLRRVAIGLAASLLALTFLTAAIGTANPPDNFASTFFWVGVWIGLPFGALLIGNVWEHLNPLLAAARALQRRVSAAAYPARLGVYPALLAFAVFTWLELVAPEGYFPRTTAAALTVYLASLLVGAVYYGTAWIRHAEFFTVLSRVLGGLAPLAWARGRVSLRLPLVGLLELDRPAGLTPLVIFFIAGVTYDGFRETEIWRRLFTAGDLPFSTTVLGTLELFGCFAIFLAIYYGVIALVRAGGRRRYSLAALGSRLAISLVPVAAAYLVAHYLSYFVTTGQELIRLASDPFGQGWNLFGTTSFTPNIELLPVRWLWYFQLAIILVGHAAGLYLAHVVAGQLYGRRVALRSQYPMLLLMIGLTSLALWILHAPLTVEGR